MVLLFQNRKETKIDSKLDCGAREVYLFSGTYYVIINRLISYSTKYLSISNKSKGDRIGSP
jgi:hypothetical protein